jgi:hypothetical protein
LGKRANALGGGNIYVLDRGKTNIMGGETTTDVCAGEKTKVFVGEKTD